MSIQELAVPQPASSTESTATSDAEKAKGALIGRGAWRHIVAFADGINPNLAPQISTGFLRRPGRVAAAVISWSSTKDGDAAKGVRISYRAISPTIEFTSDVRDDRVLDAESEVFWQEQIMYNNEAERIPLRERLITARQSAGGRMPIEKIFD